MAVTMRKMMPVRWKIVMVSVMMIKELKVRKKECDLQFKAMIETKILMMMTTQVKKLMVRKKRSFQKSSTAKGLRALTEQ